MKKVDWGILLTMPLWIPPFIIGTICGVIYYGFTAGFEAKDLLNEWFRESERQEKAKQQ